MIFCLVDSTTINAYYYSVIKYCNQPDQSDVSPVTHHSLTKNAQALIRDWVDVNPTFTLGAILSLLNVPPAHQDSVGYEVQASLLGGAAVVGTTPTGARVYHSTERMRARLLVDHEGVCDTPGKPMPAEDQVEVCREWLRANCSKTSSLNNRVTSYKLKHAVEAWSVTQPAYATRTQTNRHTGETYRDPRFYVSNGAMVQALILEGYRVARDRRQPHFVRAFISVRRPDGWGRPIKAGAEELRLVPAVPVASDHQNRARSKLRRFLDRRRKENPSDPSWRLAEAARSCGVACHDNTPERWFVKLLEREGCVKHSFRRDVPTSTGEFKKKQKVRWVRFRDMPEVWQRGHWEKAPKCEPEDTVPEQEEGKVPVVTGGERPGTPGA